ncbi:MAG: signal peptidase II [Eubacteriales bacterium]|nr:signal peptidase II [Eubacteriales bacterium]
MQFLYYMLLTAAVVVLDQIAKYLTVLFIPFQESIPFIPGLLQLTHVHNDGAAFSSFSGEQEMFLLIFLVFTGIMLFEYFKKPMAFVPFERWCIAAIYGGGLGNMVDRLRMGYVVDMFETTFMEFPVFNVADIFLSVGCVLIGIHLAFFNRKFWKDDKKK